MPQASKPTALALKAPVTPSPRPTPTLPPLTKSQCVVSGKVTDLSGDKAPIAGAIVTLTPTGAHAKTATKSSATTGETGEYTCTVEQASYSVQAKAFGVSSQACPVDFTGKGNASQDLEIDLGCVVGMQVNGNPAKSITEGETIELSRQVKFTGPSLVHDWVVSGGSLIGTPAERQKDIVYWDTTGLAPGTYRVDLTVREDKADPASITVNDDILVLPRPVQKISTAPVAMRRAAPTLTPDLALWVVIRKSAEAMSFSKKSYNHFMDSVLCGKSDGAYSGGKREFKKLQTKRFLPYTDTEAYRLLKAATEAFVVVSCGVALDDYRTAFDGEDLADLDARMSMGAQPGDLDRLWENYLRKVNGTQNHALPYFALLRDKLRDVGLRDLVPGLEDDNPDQHQECIGILRNKLTNPYLIELIWSYWHEEGMLVQTMNAISRRFQNIRSPGMPDPLVNLEIDPLRPLNNLLWGYIQDEQHRLTVIRRAYEYDHHYGITLYGKAVPEFRPADSRSKFLEAFHNLLYLCSIFFKQDDDTTVVADGFPVLNALKEVHLLLSEGAHNQFGDLTTTARIEMLMQQWLLARPEFREFLPTRVMVAYPEPWMDRVDAMKKLQGWTDVSVLHFRDLAVFGEQILLGIRYGAWSDINNPVQAANWARFWRPEIQGYTHAYRVVTGVDLAAEVADSQRAALRSVQPSLLLRQRLQGGEPIPALPPAAGSAQVPQGFRQRRAARRQYT